MQPRSFLNDTKYIEHVLVNFVTYKDHSID